MNRLTKEEVNLFWVTYNSVLFIVNNVKKVIFERHIAEVADLTDQDRYYIRNKLFLYRNLFEEARQYNPGFFELEPYNAIAKEFEKGVTGTFLVMKDPVGQTVFIKISSEGYEEVYVVWELWGTYEEMLGDFPQTVATVLLPFQDKIVCDSVCANVPKNFTKEEAQAMYEKTIAKSGVITRL